MMSNETRLVESPTAATRRSPWALLRTEWLEVPSEPDIGHGHLTWGAFSEVFEGCLHGVFWYVSRRVEDPSQLGELMTAVLVENLDVLVSPLEEQEKLDLLFAAADQVIARNVG